MPQGHPGIKDRRRVGLPLHRGPGKRTSRRLLPMIVAGRTVRVRRALVFLLVSVAFAGRASAQAIAPADYLPLSADAQWLFDRTSGSGPTEVRLDVTDVNEADTGTRYLLEVPFEGLSASLRLEIA